VEQEGVLNNAARQKAVEDKMAKAEMQKEKMEKGPKRQASKRTASRGIIPPVCLPNEAPNVTFEFAVMVERNEGPSTSTTRRTPAVKRPASASLANDHDYCAKKVCSMTDTFLRKVPQLFLFDSQPCGISQPKAKPPQAKPPQAKPPQAKPPQAEPPQAEPPQAEPPQDSPPQDNPCSHKAKPVIDIDKLEN